MVVHDTTERKHADDVLRFLAESGATLASSLDYRTTLANVARLAVPTLADWCAVDVMEEDGTVERLAVEHSDPEKVALAYELQERYPSDPETTRGVRKVLKTGEPDMMAEIPEELLDQAAVDVEHRTIMRELGLRSYMVVPMVARGRNHGAITLVSAESGRRYEETDLRLAEELARRAALAVDNAKLYEEAQREISERRDAEEALRPERGALQDGGQAGRRGDLRGRHRHQAHTRSERRVPQSARLYSPGYARARAYPLRRRGARPQEHRPVPRADPGRRGSTLSGSGVTGGKTARW